MTFGDKLKQIRHALDLSQDELARILGTSKQVISRYERGERTPKLTIAQDYAAKLNVPVEDLIDNSRNITGVSFGYTFHSDLEQKLKDRLENRVEQHSAGVQNHPQITDEEREIIRLYRAASPEIRAAIQRIVKE